MQPLSPKVNTGADGSVGSLISSPAGHSLPSCYQRVLSKSRSAEGLCVFPSSCVSSEVPHNGSQVSSSHSISSVPSNEFFRRLPPSTLPYSRCSLNPEQKSETEKTLDGSQRLTQFVSIALFQIKNFSSKPAATQNDVETFYMKRDSGSIAKL